MPMTVGSRGEGEQAVGRTWWQQSAAARPGHLHRALSTGVRLLPGIGGMGTVHIPPVLAGQAGAVPRVDGLPDRRGLFGRLAAVFVAGAGVMGLVTLPLPAPGSDAVAMSAVCAVALALGAGIWFVP